MILAVLFFLVALVYSSVGFGGGSSYIALLQWSGMAVSALPILSLACNLIVSSQGFAQFARAGYFSASRSLPFILLSVPAAYLGGLYVIKESTFQILLAASLTIGGLLLLFPVEKCTERGGNRIRQWIRRYGFLLGLPLGFLSGVVGIGGGIFLDRFCTSRSGLAPRKSLHWRRASSAPTASRVSSGKCKSSAGTARFWRASGCFRSPSSSAVWQAHDAAPPFCRRSEFDKSPALSFFLSPAISG